MVKDFFKNNWVLIFVEALVVLAFVLFYGSFGDITIDSFREAYIPQQMLEGGVLYKNIFCIYPPLGYLINEFLYSIFGVNLNVLYVANMFVTIGIFYFITQISDMFWGKYTTLCLNIFSISGMVLSPNVFNMFLPYSSGIVYGLLFISASIYFALKEKYPLAYLLYGLAVCSKIEFLPAIFGLLYISRKKDLLKNILCMLIPPVLISTILFFQGVRIQDLITAAGLVGLIGNSNSLHEFYSSMGFVPRVEHLQLYFINFIKFIFPINLNLYQEVIMWIFPVCLGIFIFKYKILNIKEKFIIITTLLISAKVFFALTLQSYGVYLIPFALISLGVMLKGKTKKIFIILLLVWASIIGYKHVMLLNQKKYEIKTNFGIVKTTESSAKNLISLLEQLKNIPQNSTIAVYPEFLAVNFLSGIKSDNKFYSLIPLYVETFGEENIIFRLQNKSPDYVIINNYNTFAYGANYFGKDYAQNIMNYINNNYSKISSVVEDFVIYKARP